MRLGEYYRGIPLNLVTRLPPEEVARRLDAVLPSPFRPFATGIVGVARPSWLKLFYRRGLFGYNGMPILTGPIEPHPRGTLLRLLYRGRIGTRLAFPFAFLLVILGVVPAFLLDGGELAAEIGPLLGVALAAAIIIATTLPLAIHIFAIRNAEARLEEMAAFLRARLDAKDIALP